MRPRHVPQRTCVGCRTSSAKRAFVRVVRTPEEGVAVDETGRANGRGAYLCGRATCWEAALKGDRLGRALRTSVSSEDAAALRAFASRFDDDSVGSNA